MASEDAERVRGAYEALNRSDTEAALAILEPDAEWCEHSTLPEAGTYRGREAIEAFLEAFLESWHEFRQEIERIVEAGDRVALLLHSFAVGKERRTGRGSLRARLDHARRARRARRHL